MAHVSAVRKDERLRLLKVILRDLARPLQLQMCCKLLDEREPP